MSLVFNNKFLEMRTKVATNTAGFKTNFATKVSTTKESLLNLTKKNSEDNGDAVDNRDESEKTLPSSNNASAAAANKLAEMKLKMAENTNSLRNNFATKMTTTKESLLIKMNKTKVANADLEGTETAEGEITFTTADDDGTAAAASNNNNNNKLEEMKLKMAENTATMKQKMEENTATMKLKMAENNARIRNSFVSTKETLLTKIQKKDQNNENNNNNNNNNNTGDASAANTVKQEGSFDEFDDFVIDDDEETTDKAAASTQAAPGTASTAAAAATTTTNNNNKKLEEMKLKMAENTAAMKQKMAENNAKMRTGFATGMAATKLSFLNMKSKTEGGVGGGGGLFGFGAAR